MGFTRTEWRFESSHQSPGRLAAAKGLSAIACKAGV
jgi:hypothetical protein